jgi:hypothetical protein
MTLAVCYETCKFHVNNYNTRRASFPYFPMLICIDSILMLEFSCQMTGRPIQVETGYGERLPSIDTRLPRMRESDSVIEVSIFLIRPVFKFLLIWINSAFCCLSVE